MTAQEEREHVEVTIYAGRSSQRQSVGLPGHCERCAKVGHERAHPKLGCADVGCDYSHDTQARHEYFTGPELRGLLARATASPTVNRARVRRT